MQAFDLESEESSDNNASTPHGHNVNQGWDNEAHLIWPQPGACIISIRVQSPALQAVIKAAVCEVTGDAVTATKCVVTSQLGIVTCVVELPCWYGYDPGNKVWLCTEEVVPALEYVLKPTYSVDGREEGKGQVLFV